ncbi:MAG: histidine phosphatase family protein [Balneolaceae bacterium]|nr:histidine phosphatase family protein [Balneolaceae bacterium]
MSLTNLYIVRHGQTEYNRLDRMQGRGIDQSLNETGRLQAAATADFLSGHNLDLAISSSLKRSRETAQVVAERFNLNLFSYKELDEIDFGIYEGQHSSDIKDDLEMIQERWRRGQVQYAMEGGESPSQVLERVQGRTSAILKEHVGKNILIVLHGRLIRILLSYWLGYGLERMHEIKHANGGLNHLRWNGTAFEIVCLNKTDHLPEAAPETEK